MNPSTQPVNRTEVHTDADGNKCWYRNGVIHRDDGPAIELANADKYWYRDGQRHREDGPAIEYIDGTKVWCRRGLTHRDDGPAVESADGSKEWWENDRFIAAAPAETAAVEDQARAENKQRDIERVASAIKIGTQTALAVSRPLKLKPSSGTVR